MALGTYGNAFETSWKEQYSFRVKAILLLSAGGINLFLSLFLGVLFYSYRGCCRESSDVESP